MMIAKAYIGHQIENRTRFYLPGEEDNFVLFSLIEEKFSICEGVTRVQINSTTGSVLICHEVPLSQIESYAKAHDLFEIDSSIHEKKNWAKDLLEKVDSIDKRVIEVTDGELNLASLAGFSLLSAGVFQISRKQFFPAASTLIIDAFRILIQYNKTMKSERKGQLTAME